jgi:predicted PurR-regulated permease PerM
MPTDDDSGPPARSIASQAFTLIPIGLFVLLFYLLYRIFSPFLGSIAWAIILGMLFTPIHRRLLVELRFRRRLAALTMTLVVILVIVIPGTFMSVVLARQAVKGVTALADTVGKLQLEGPGSVMNKPYVVRIQKSIGPYLDLDEKSARSAVIDALQNLSRKALNWSTQLVGNIVRLFFSLFVMLFTLYYIFKDGGAAMRYVEGIHPMIRQTRLFRTLEELTFSTFYAGFVVAAVQGVLAGLAFVVLGVPSAFFWGAMTALMSFVPFVGATSIWLPVTIWFALQGDWPRAIGLAIWGVGVVSLADNFLKPALISGRMRLHPLLVFFSVLGGLSLFGPIGVILGPLVLVLCLGLLDTMVGHPVAAGD